MRKSTRIEIAYVVVAVCICGCGPNAAPQPISGVRLEPAEPDSPAAFLTSEVVGQVSLPSRMLRSDRPEHVRLVGVSCGCVELVAERNNQPPTIWSTGELLPLSPTEPIRIIPRIRLATAPDRSYQLARFAPASKPRQEIAAVFPFVVLADVECKPPAISFQIDPHNPVPVDRCVTILHRGRTSEELATPPDVIYSSRGLSVLSVRPSTPVRRVENDQLWEMEWECILRRTLATGEELPAAETAIVRFSPSSPMAYLPLSVADPNPVRVSPSSLSFSDHVRGGSERTLVVQSADGQVIEVTAVDTSSARFQVMYDTGRQSSILLLPVRYDSTVSGPDSTRLTLKVRHANGVSTIVIPVSRGP
jgi:hypothetical protein